VQIYEPGEDDPPLPPEDAAPGAEDEDPIPPQPGEDETVIVDPQPPEIPPPIGDPEPPRKYYIRGQPVRVLTERIEYLDAAGKLVTESLRDYSRRTIRDQYASLDQFLRRWRDTEHKAAILAELAEAGCCWNRWPRRSAWISTPSI
jgi:type I restriction enzyme, R subunit